MVGRYTNCEALSVIRPLIEDADLVVGELFAGSTGEVTDDWLVEQQNPLPGAGGPAWHCDRSPGEVAVRP